MQPSQNESREHPLDEWLSFEQASIQKFKKTYPELWQAFGDSINLARAVPFVIGQQQELTEIEMHRLYLWQKVLHYQAQSLFLLLQAQLDAGFALLRLAAELCRDVIRIADDEKMLVIWLEREAKPNQHKKRFKFMLNSPDEEAVHTIYKFASQFGVHGHQTDTMFSEVIGAVDERNSMISFGVSNYGVLDAVHMWLISFLPMHNVCAKTFVAKYFSIRPEIFLTLRDYQATMNSFIQTMSGYLEDLKNQRKKLQ